MMAAISILAGIAMGIVILHWLAETVKAAAVTAERERQLEALQAIRVKQDREMLRERSQEDVARDLDRGVF